MKKPPEDQEQFVKRMWPRLVGSMTLITGDRAAAEDLAQEALIRACSTWSSVSAAASADAWTFRVAFNLANSRWRRKGAEGRAYNKVAETGRAPCHHEADHALRLTLAPPEPPGSSQSAGARHEADTGTTRPDRPENTSTNDHGKVRFNVN